MRRRSLPAQVLEGDTVMLSPPFGDFHIAHAEKKWINDEVANRRPIACRRGDASIDERLAKTRRAQAAPVVLLSGGVGITPTLSMLASVQAGSRPVVWLHGAENSLDHPFKEYLRGLGRALEAENKSVTRSGK